MKKKLVALALISALAISALGLAACGSDFKSIYENPYENEAYAQLVEQGKILDSQKNLNMDFGLQKVDGIFVLFANEDPTTHLPVQKVYNSESDAIVGTFADSSTTTGTKTVTVTYALSGGGNTYFKALFVNGEYHDYFYAKKHTVTVDTATPANNDDVTEYTLYDADGTSFATCEEKPFAKIDTIFADGDYYRLNKEGKFEKAGSLAKNSIVLDLNFDTMIDGKYYYTEDNQLFVYDSSFVLVNYYQFPSFATSSNFFVLNDGNVLIQYSYRVSPYNTDYTFYEGGNNYKVITQIYKIKNGSLKDVETVCLFNTDFTARDSEPNGFELRAMLGSSIENYSSVRYITDKHIDTHTKIVSVNNDGSIDKVLSESFIGQSETALAQPLASGKFIVSTKNGSRYLVNAKGDILGDVTGAIFNQKYIVLDGKIYDHDFNELATFDEDEWAFSKMNNSIVLQSSEDANKYKLFANGAFNEITLNDGQTLVNGTERYYVIRTVADASTTYSYYNENGVKLLDSAVYFDNIKSTRTGKLLCNGYDVANTKYVNVVLYTALAAK